MYQVEREEFEAMMAEAVDTLPEEFASRLANVTFAVEDWPGAEDYARPSTPAGSTLLGVYRGVPLTRRGRGYNLVLPDRIVLFQGPIERSARDEDDLRLRVGHVLRHEVAHHFGISDERLREIGAY